MGCILVDYLSTAILKALGDVMDTERLENITSAATTLPENERAKLAHDLVASLNGSALVLQKLGTLKFIEKSKTLNQVKQSFLMLIKPFHAPELGLRTKLEARKLP